MSGSLFLLNSVKVWLYGLVSAVVSSAAGCVAMMAIDPNTFNLQSGLPKLLQVAAALGIIAMFNYLQKHPLPAWDGADRRGTGLTAATPTEGPSIGTANPVEEKKP